MKYRHVFHAGNFADLHKHLVWVALLQAMQRKDKGFLVIDTHAGAGGYDLQSPEARQSDEAARGIKALQAAMSASSRVPAGSDDHMHDFLYELQRLRKAMDLKSGYPGSPLWTLALMRRQDRLVCFDTQPTEQRQLEKRLAQLDQTLTPRFKRNVKVICADGFASLSGWLPPIERRALILFDPPYENSDGDFAALKAALVSSLGRLANAVIAIWYPIKDRADIERALKTLRSAIAGQAPGMKDPPLLRSELWLHPCDSRVGLNGSGMLLVNPPWQLEDTLRDFMPPLLRALDRHGTGGWQVC